MNYHELIHNFVLNESQKVDVFTSIQTLSDLLSSIRPTSLRDNRRLKQAKLALEDIKRHCRRMDNEINELNKE